MNPTTGDEQRRIALLICMGGDAGTIKPRCSDPCEWCLNEARLEMEAVNDTR